MKDDIRAIEEAAKETLETTEFRTGFISGVEWRDKNPSPAVKGLVEACKNHGVNVTTPQYIQGILKALTHYEESLNE